MPSGIRSIMVLIVLALSIASLNAPAAHADDSAPESPMVKLLKSGRVPEARLGSIVEMIGKRGSAGDIEYLFERLTTPNGFPPSIQERALDALAEAASNRNLRPKKNTEKLAAMLSADPKNASALLRTRAIRLAGLWKLETLADTLGAIAGAGTSEDAIRVEALDALAMIGGQAARSRVEALTEPSQPASTRILAVAALARLDIDAAAERAVPILALPPDAARDLAPLLGAFLNRQGGADVLAAKLARHAPSPDAAKLALRTVYALGHADESLVAALSRAAGIAAEAKPLSPAELSQMVADVAAKGDPTRGESVFRRADLNCMSCHSVSKAGGEVGPDLSAIGQTSPPDYIINSILNPDQAIKEQYHTLVVQTSEGQVFQGIVTDKDEQRVVLKEATGASRVVPVAIIEDQKPGGSLMPKGLASLMTRPEFVDLVRFLSELGKPGPYAIRSIPTLQRWRVLKPVPEALAGTIPDRTLFHDQIATADAGRWATVYAKVSGALPLLELVKLANSPVLYLQGEINVSNAGAIRLGLDSADGVRVWIDGEPIADGHVDEPVSLSAGRHAITVRIDTNSRRPGELKVELKKPAGSSAEFTVVGGH
jgi:putative heme-binding domain-containing protein